MDVRIDGKVALITGGSRGIGKAIATTFAESGAAVMIVSRKADALEKAADEIGHGCQWFPANTGDPEQAEAAVDATIERLGGVDILVNNAATNPYAGPTIGIDLPRWNKTLQVNLTAPLRVDPALLDASTCRSTAASCSTSPRWAGSRRARRSEPMT